MAAQFINVDLDIESRSPLDYFCAQMANGTKVSLLHCGDNGGRGYFARLECADGGITCEPDSIINQSCEYIEDLDERARGEWDVAHFKSFDLGFENTAKDRCYQCPLRPGTVKRISDLGGALAISIYNHDDNIEPSEYVIRGENT